MPVWSEKQFDVALKDFEDGLRDARCDNVDAIAYRINSEYKKGVDIARQLMENFESVRRRILNAPLDAKKIAAKLSESEKYLGTA
jgi:hypothetical protein